MESSKTDRVTRVRAALAEALELHDIVIVDESDRHAGHPGQRAPASHLRVRVVSPDFEGLSLVARHRLVQGAVAAEFERGLHALAIEARTPAEAGAD